MIFPLFLCPALTFSLSRRPAELATKYANFSEGACKPGYASAMMTAIFPRYVVLALDAGTVWAVTQPCGMPART